MALSHWFLLVLVALSIGILSSLYAIHGTLVTQTNVLKVLHATQLASYAMQGQQQATQVLLGRTTLDTPAQPTE
jgi:hypothetical protein